jgi:hypothetical protein
VGGTEKGRDSGIQGEEGAAEGLTQAGAEEVRTLTQVRFLHPLPENFVPSYAAVSLGGTDARDELDRETVWTSGRTGVVAEGLRSRLLALANQHPWPGQLPGWVRGGADLQSVPVGA